MIHEGANTGKIHLSPLRRSLGRATHLLLVLLIAGGCATAPASPHDTSFQRKYGEYTYCELDSRLQASETDCGPACLLAVMQYWQAHHSQTEGAEEHLPHSATGYSLSELKDIATDQGLKAYIIAMQDAPRESLKEQIRKGRPVICAVQRPLRIGRARYIPILGQILQAGVSHFGPKTNHFVVVMGVSDRRVLLMDPAVGYDSVSWKKFQRSWSKMKYATLLLSA